MSRLVNQKMFMSGQLTQTNNREEYKNVLIAAQDSAAVQLLLEACLETEDDIVSLIFYTSYLCSVPSSFRLINFMCIIEIVF